MEYEELKKELDAIELEFKLRKQKAIELFCSENNPYKVGDIIIDHIGPIKINRIRYDYFSRPPQCVYDGVELKKDLTLKKKLITRSVYQSNEVK